MGGKDLQQVEAHVTGALIGQVEGFQIRRPGEKARVFGGLEVYFVVIHR